MKKRVLTEVVYYFLLSLIGLALVSVIFEGFAEDTGTSKRVDPLRHAAATLVFFVVTFYALKKEKISRNEIGLKFKPLLFSLLIAVAAAVIVFPLFTASFDLYFSFFYGYDFSPEKGFLAPIKKPVWGVAFAFVQIFLVGLPEELLYRGYIQGRLNQVFDRKFALFGTRFGFSLFITSALFAFGHFLLEPVPGRLAVFFPSLLFGYLKEMTGAITAPAIFHGLSNFLLELLYQGL